MDQFSTQFCNQELSAAAFKVMGSFKDTGTSWSRTARIRGVPVYCNGLQRAMQIILVLAINRLYNTNTILQNYFWNDVILCRHYLLIQYIHDPYMLFHFMKWFDYNISCMYTCMHTYTEVHIHVHVQVQCTCTCIYANYSILHTKSFHCCTKSGSIFLSIKIPTWFQSSFSTRWLLKL